MEVVINKSEPKVEGLTIELSIEEVREISRVLEHMEDRSSWADRFIEVCAPEYYGLSRTLRAWSA